MNFRKPERLLPLLHKTISPAETIDLGQFVEFPKGYRPANPSIARYGRGFVVSVRGVAYTINRRSQQVDTAEGMPSLNRMIFLDDNLAFAGAVPLSCDKLNGLEDIKLFSGLGRLWGVATLLVDDRPGASACKIALIQFNQELTDCQIVALDSPFGFRQEKNWAPFFLNEHLHFVYSYAPLLLLRYLPDRGAVELVGAERPLPQELKFLECGSSGGIETSSGFVFLAHRRVVRLPRFHRIFLTSIQVLSPDLKHLTRGPYFSMGRATLQYSNGMTLDGDRVLISYGEMDSKAYLARFPRSRFEREVCPSQLRNVPASGPSRMAASALS